MNGPILFQCQVLDNEDPLMLGRVRGRLLAPPNNASYESVLASITSPPWNEEKDKWTTRDPFIFTPLLPYFVYQVPKVEELIQIIFVNNDYPYQNQYYVQSNFYSPTSSNFQFSQGANAGTGTGMQIKNPKPLKNQDGTYTDKEIHKGVFPQPGDNAILGRGSADLIVKENEVLLRAGKFKGQTLKTNVVPAGNPQRGFLQLSRFQSIKIPQPTKTRVQLNNIVVSVKYLIEWVITNPENKEDKFAGSVYLYQLKPDLSTNSKNITVDSVINENLKKIVIYESFTLLSKIETIEFINNFIKDCNDRNKTVSGVRLFPGTQTFQQDNKFPIFYRPNNLTYSSINPSSSNTTSSEATNNVTEIFNSIKLYPALNQGGFGLIYAKSKVGKPTEIKKIKVPQSKYVNSPTVYGALGADKLFLLSHFSSIPGKGKINFNYTLYGISNDKFSDEIIPKTSSMVRGEELLELINLIVRFLTTHTHAFPGLPPVPVTQDGTTSVQILTELQNAVNKILNTNIRIN